MRAKVQRKVNTQVVNLLGDLQVSNISLLITLLGIVGAGTAAFAHGEYELSDHGGKLTELKTSTEKLTQGQTHIEKEIATIGNKQDIQGSVLISISKKVHADLPDGLIKP